MEDRIEKVEQERRDRKWWEQKKGIGKDRNGKKC